MTLLSVAVTVFSLAFAYLVRYLINSATAGKASGIWIFSAALLGVLLLKIFLKTWNNFAAEKLRAKSYSELRTRVYSKILRAEYASLQGYHSGDLLNRLTGDVQEVSTDTVGLRPAVAGMIVQCLGAIVALITIDPLFTCIYVVCGIILGGITALFRRQIKKRHKDVLQADGEVRSFVQEGLTSVVAVKAYGAEEKTTARTQTLSNVYYDKRMKRNILRSEMNFVFSLLSNFGLIFAVVWCSISVLHGNEDYGAILSVVLLLTQLQQPLTSFSSIMPVYYARIASAERLAELDELPTETLEKTCNLDEYYEQMHAIRFENVSFTYGRDIVLRKATVEIEKGQIVCLTGTSGAGKSTVFKLLLSVFTPTGGELSLEGEFPNDISLPITAKERELFAYVPQGNFLFSGTIYENLTFFIDEEKATEEAVRAALEAACAEFVFELPDGLQTKLLEGGGGLSEGQMQRLNVARAILSDRPILLLDEATSALDASTERRLLENIRGLKNKTCIIVTHRPAALEIADRILTVEKGKIIDKK